MDATLTMKGLTVIVDGDHFVIEDTTAGVTRCLSAEESRMFRAFVASCTLLQTETVAR